MPTDLSIGKYSFVDHEMIETTFQPSNPVRESNDGSRTGQTDSTGQPVSIIVVNHDGGALLANCIESVRQHTDNYEVIIVDNASQDGSIDLVKTGPDLRVVRLSSNLGFARASNVGIRLSRAGFIVLLNSDTTVTHSWLNELISLAEQSHDIGIVAPKLLRPGYPRLLDSTGIAYSYQTGYPLNRGHGQRDDGQFDRYTELVSCCFACALVKHKLFDELGLLDEKMFFYFEDVDFGLRARMAGWRVVFCPGSVVFHIGGGSTPRDNIMLTALKPRAYRLRVMLKNYQLKGMIRYGGKLILSDLLRVAAGLKNRDWNYVRFYADAFAWNLAHPPIIERAKVQRKRRLTDEEIFAGLH